MVVMRYISMMFILATLLLQARAGEEPERSGTVRAQVSVSADGAAEVAAMKSSLPQRILDQLKPIFQQRAIEEHAEMNPGDAVEYEVLLDWKVVERDGKEQLDLALHEGDLIPIVKVAPRHPDPFRTVEVQLAFTVGIDGTVDDVTTIEADNRFREFNKAAEDAMERWRFIPHYKRGIARPREAVMPMLFLAASDEEPLETGDRFQVSFRLDDDGNPHRLHFEARVPECHDQQALLAEIRAAISASKEAELVRNGETKLREGIIWHEVPECLPSDS